MRNFLTALVTSALLAGCGANLKCAVPGKLVHKAEGKYELVCPETGEKIEIRLPKNVPCFHEAKACFEGTD